MEKEEKKELEEEISDNDEKIEREEEKTEDFKNYKQMYEELRQEHNMLKEKIAQEETVRGRENSFAEAGLKKPRYKMYHKYTEGAEDIVAVLKELMAEYPEDFEVEQTNNRNAFPTEKTEKKIEEDEIKKQKEYLRQQGIGG